MNRFLRRYSKLLLAIFGTGLMITFLIPFAFNQIPNLARGRATWAEVDGEKVSLQAYESAQQDMQMFDRAGLTLPGIGQLQDPAHWYLLVREAEDAGFVGAPASASLPPDQLDLLYARMGGNRQLVNDSFGRFFAVDQMLRVYQTVGRTSDLRIRSYAERYFHEVSARIVVLKGEADADVPEPTEAEILEQFEAYKNESPGMGERGFGYMLPDRLQLEWLTISNDSVRTMIEDSNAINGASLAKHWQKYQAERNFPEAQPGIPVPDVVRTDLLNQLTTEARTEIQRAVEGRLIASKAGLPMPDGYAALPANWSERQIDYADLAAELQAEFPGLPTPAYTSISDRWLTFEDLLEFDDLIGARTDQARFGVALNAPGVLRDLREFEPDAPRFVVQAGITGPTLVSPAGDLVFFRVTAADAARAPHSVDDVRDRVVDDIRRIKDYERLAREADAIEAKAKSDGLLATALEYDGVISRQPRISLFQQSLPGVGQAPDAMEEIVNAALALPKDTPISETPREDRTFVIDVPERLIVVVVELLAHRPIDQERFDGIAPSLSSFIAQTELQDISPSMTDVFSLDALKERHAFKLEGGGDGDGEGDGTAAPEDATAAVGG